MQLFSLVLDIVLLVTALLLIRRAYRNGFLRSVVLFVGLLAAIFLSIGLSRWLANVLYEQCFRSAVIEQVNEVVQSTAGEVSIADLFEDLMGALPGFFRNPVLSVFGGQEQISAQLQEQTGGVLDSLGRVVADTIVGPIAISLLQVICCLLIFLICVIIVRLAASLFKGLYAVPILGTVNSVLGAVVGVFQAAIGIYILALLAYIVVSMTGNTLSWLNREIIDNTYLFRWFYRF